ISLTLTLAPKRNLHCVPLWSFHSPKLTEAHRLRPTREPKSGSYRIARKQDMQMFDWTNWKDGALPTLESHSEAKLKVLRSYVEDYICILCSDSFGRDCFRITLVDGFAGGGAYNTGAF